mmetsp:Transcript_16090/g.24106  ORF Transcript_16090/g.24106 Transcript_16090/m.24106 type:complete len:113 (-) Transcript_16090:334-672(-)|eukprot:207578_1
MAPTFLGGKLKLKGGKKKKKKSKHKVETTTKESKYKNDSDLPDAAIDNESDADDGLTEVERKSLQRRKERESEDIKLQASQSHRDRIEDFNEKLGSLTELNDIPRVSAAGNG